MAKHRKSALWLAAVTWLTGGTATAAGPAVGDVAPTFSLQGSDGATHSLAQYKDKQAMVLAWFPKAFTPG